MIYFKIVFNKNKQTNKAKQDKKQTNKPKQNKSKSKTNKQKLIIRVTLFRLTYLGT